MKTKMKKTISFFVACLLTTILSAQIQKPVKWNIQCGEIDKNGTITLTFKANIDEGWHIYGMQMPEEGPIPTSFHFTEKKSVSLNGTVEADKKTKCGMDALFGMELDRKSVV